ncbi:hypothetical protein ACHAWF_003334 [Thalassiosira exigua]
MLSKLATTFALGCALAAVGISYVQTTVWWAGYDVRNCPGCQAIVDWAEERSRGDIPAVVAPDVVRAFQDDGVVVLSSAVSPSKVSDLADAVEALSDTFMTSVLSRVVLKQYRKYEHKLDTRSELVRDWAVHGPLASWAAELLGADEVRLYNSEKIYSAGSESPMGCNAAWHRDTVAAPFPTNVKSVTFNVYLDDIGAEGPHGDVLIYAKGSHKDLDLPPIVTQNVFEPVLKVGDVLAHDPHVYHTPSGRGCWNRRSLQFRYVASPTTFRFEPNRFPHGPIPWTMAHANGVAPHGLKEGDPLAGPWYPRVYPTPLEEEHVPIEGKPWGVLGLLSVTKEAVDIAENLGIGNDENCTLDDNAGAVEHPAYFGFDGPIRSCDGWEMIGGVPVHRDGQMKLSVQRMANEG